MTLQIPLKATKIAFNKFTIVYTVEPVTKLSACEGIVYCNPNIKTKELILMPTLINKSNLEVVFTPSNVSPQFYQKILNGSLFDINEYSVELNNIYVVGDIVGYVLN